MPRKNLTARFVETVSAETRTDFWDDVLRGLVLRVSETGVKSWTLVYTRQSDGSKQRLTIGKHPVMTLEAARRKAMGLLAGIGEGKDPSQDRRALRASMTVRDLGALFIEKYAKPNKRTWKEDERILEREVYPAIGGVKASQVKRRDVLDIVQAKADAGFVAQSRQVLATVRKMFGWAVDEDYLESSPAAGIKPRGKAVQRERVLSDAELRRVWNALQLASLAPQTADIVRLLILTGQRSGEVCGMARGEIDLDAATWTIPKERVKNGRTHVAPLSSTALAIIAERSAVIDGGPETPLFCV
jgi:Arm DNA-binding domain/Phage integrase family